MNNKLCYILMIFFGSFLFYQGDDVLFVPGYIKVLICFSFFLISYRKYCLTCNYKIVSFFTLKSYFEHNGIRCFYLFYLPYLILFAYTIFLFVFGNLIPFQLKSSVTMFGSITAAMLLIPSTLQLFKRDGLYFWIYSCLITYFIILVKYFFDFGFEGFVHFIEYNENLLSYLESHELLFIFGIFWVYLFLKNNKNKKDYFLLVLISTFIILGYKRITLIALLLLILFKFFSNVFTVLFKISLNKIYLLSNYILYFSTIIYMLLSAYGISFFKFISNTFGINFMGRIQILEYFSGATNFLSFLRGNGFMFSDSYLKLDPNMKYYVAIHNDIYRVFLDIGFFGFLIFFGYLIFILFNKITNKKFNNFELNEFLLIYLIFHFTSDNLMIYPRFFGMLCITVLYGCYLNNEKYFKSLYCDKKFNMMFLKNEFKQFINGFSRLLFIESLKRHLNKHLYRND